MEQTDRYYMSIAKNIAKESRCLRRKVGAILVAQDEKTIVKSVNNPIPDKLFCEMEGCLREKHGIASGMQIEICRCVHAETSLIIQCALDSVSPAGASVYTTLFPCQICAKILCASGIKRLIYVEPYSNLSAQSIFQRHDVEIIQLIL